MMKGDTRTDFPGGNLAERVLFLDQPVKAAREFRLRILLGNREYHPCAGPPGNCALNQSQGE